MKNIRLLIVDDELEFYKPFYERLKRSYDIEKRADVEAGLDLIKRETFDAVLFDLKYKDRSYDDGLSIFLPKAIKNAGNRFPIIVCTSDPREETRQIVQQLGAATLFEKRSMDAEAWDQKIRYLAQAFQEGLNAATTNNEKDNETAATDPFVAVSERSAEIKKRLKHYAKFKDDPLLILGETGTGKEVAAQYLHQCKGNSKLPFVPVNLTALNDELFQSELFGHVKGAFTGAIADKTGYFETAKGGTLFIDEIGEISQAMQVKLLRVLQERVFQKVGSTQNLSLEVHLIFATNVNLEEAVEAGIFRADFYERINTYSVSLPPLRERPEEILPLIEYFLTQDCNKSLHPLCFGKSAGKLFTEDALKQLIAYEWPSNIRQLRNTIKQLLADAEYFERDVIHLEHLPDRFQHQKQYVQPSKMPQTEAQVKILPEASLPSNWPIKKQRAFQDLERFEKQLIAEGGRKDLAAKALGMTSEQNLLYYIKKYHKEYRDLFGSLSIINKIYKLN